MAVSMGNDAGLRPPASAVVLAFGPGPLTEGAVARARRIVGPGGHVAVVAAVPPGVAPARSAARRGAATTDSTGTAGLVEVLGACPPGPTLILHDDVHLSAAGARRLVAAHDLTGSVAVATTNDLGTDHGVGALPASKHAAARCTELERDRATAPPTSARVVRPVCFVADRDLATELARRGLVDARIRFDDVDLGFVAVPGAVAAHDNRCTRRLADPTGPSGRPLLVAHLIVRDEEELLPGALASLEGLVDRIEVCDTGSVDRTVEIAEAAGCHVIHRTWRNDFAWARNQVLDRCRDACYVLTLDADERVRCTDPEQLRRVLATYVHEYRAYRIRVTSTTGGSDGLATTFAASRVFDPDGVEWRGALHEVPVVVADGLPIEGALIELLDIEHLGYETAVVAQRGKADRNTAIARTDYEADPTAKHALEYARSLMLAPGYDPRQVCDLIDEALDAARHAEPAVHAYVLGAAAHAHLELGDAATARSLAEQAIDLVPAEDMAMLALVRACESQHDDAGLVAAFVANRARPSIRAVYAYPRGRAEIHLAAIGAWARLGDLERAATEALELAGTSTWSIDGWAVLLEHVRDDAPGSLPEVLLGLLLADRTGSVIAAATTTLQPTLLAHIGAAYVLSGGSDPTVCTTAITAAILTEQWDLLAAWRPHLDTVPAEARNAMAARAIQRGRSDVAALLQGTEQLLGTDLANRT